MLQELAVRIPRASVARLLSAYQFMSVLRNTLQWLQKRVNRIKVSSEVGVGNEELLDPPEDSSDTMESSSSERGTSKKRKFDGTEVTASEDTTTVAFRVLYMAICGTIRQLESLTRDPEQTQGFAVEHMKSSLRSTPEDAAHTLGSCFYLTNRIIRTPHRHWHQKRIFTRELQKLLADTGYRSCILPVIDLWNRRSLTGQHSPTSSNSAFMACCMLPLLQLLDTCRQSPAPSEEMAEVIKSLEGLLIDHTILPLRSSFLDLEPATELEKDVSFASFSDRMVSLLRQFLPHLESPFLRADCKTDKHLAISIMSLLFDIAVTCRPRTTPKLRRLENPWLEQLFIRLAKCAETLFPPVSSVRAQKDHIRVIKWMLRKAVDHQVQLSLSTTKALLDQASGLFRKIGDSHAGTRVDSEDDNEIEWDLVSLCILNDSNSFVIPSYSASDNEEYAYRPPNKYLTALLRNITEEMCYRSLEEDRHYDFKLLHVIEPLCNAFIGARDLTGFLGHWREQLSIVQERQESQGNHFDLVSSIWEDERLLLYVAQSIELSLTAGQIDRVLSTAAHELAPSIPNVLNDKPMSLASLTILDCVFTGLFKEATLVRLDSIALSIFGLLGVLVSTPSNMLSPHGWRVWRIKATIADRWSSLRNSSPFKRKAHPAICIASELINRISSELTLRDDIDLTEELYAVKFMLKFAAMEDSLWEDLQFSSRQKILSAVMKLIEVMEPFCHRISHDHFGTMMRSDANSTSEQSTLKISPIDRFYFDCVNEIIESPGILSYLDEETQRRLVRQLYWSSVFQQRFLGSENGPSFDYSSCWKKLLRYDALDDNGSMTRCLRTFQVDRYCNTSDFGDPKYWEIGAADYVIAFRSIQATPTNAFDRGQRSKLANRVLRVLLQANILNLAKTTEHLILLTRLIQMPNKTFNVLTNENEIPRKGSGKPRDEMALIGLARGIDGVVGWSEDNMHSIKALKQLTRSVLSYLFSTLDQQSSIHYLQTLYLQMAQSLEDHYKNESACTTAFSALFEVSLNHFSRHREDLPDTLKPVGLDTTRQYHLESILKCLDDVDRSHLNEPERRHSCGVNLECLAGYSDLLAIHPHLQDISGRLFSGDGPFQTLKSLGHDPNLDKTAVVCKDCCSIEYLAVCLAKVEIRLYAYDYNLHPNLAYVSELSKKLHSHRERNDLMSHFKDVMPSLGIQSKKELCFNFHIEKNEYLEYSQLLRIQLGIVSLNRNANSRPLSNTLTVQNSDQQLEQLSGDLSRLLVHLCRELSQRTDFAECMLSMQCVNMLLQSHTRVISQWHIDELLAAITSKACNLGERTGKNSGRLYIGLCRSFSTILSVHRAKIGGRYHLVVLALQALLRCLFIPYKYSEAVEGETSVFGETHATAFGRLLSMICDPTVSSVTRTRNRSRLELNDETKKARSIAGQHLPYVIMEFCGCQLTGRLLPGMRAALNAGLYAVLAVISPDMMRTMNAAMASSSRSVFKALYDDYKRFGRWKGD